MTRIAFLGLGVMGAPMAGHLVRAGHQVRGYNRSAEKARAWAAHTGGEACSNAAEAAAGAEFVIACVGADADVEEMFAAAAPALAATGGLFVDHTTASADLARRLGEAATSQGFAFLDAPVSGGQAGAENARLTIMVGGEAAAFARAEPVMRAYGANIVHVGPAGAGQLAKMANQLAIAGVVQGLSESLAFVERAGLDPALVFAAISKGAAQSWQMDNRWASMAERRFDFGFAVDWMRKDLGLALAEARRIGASAPLAALVDQFYADVQRLGGGRWDTSSLIERLRQKP